MGSFSVKNIAAMAIWRLTHFSGMTIWHLWMNDGNYFLNLPSLIDSISRPFIVNSDGVAGKVFVKMPVRVIVGLRCEKEK